MSITTNTPVRHVSGEKCQIVRVDSDGTLVIGHETGPTWLGDKDRAAIAGYSFGEQPRTWADALGEPFAEEEARKERIFEDTIDKGVLVQRIETLTAMVDEKDQHVSNLQKVMSDRVAERDAAAFDLRTLRTKVREQFIQLVKDEILSRDRANASLRNLGLEEMKPMRRVIIKNGSDELLFEIDEVESDKDDDALANEYRDKVSVYGVAKSVRWTYALTDGRSTETKDVIEEGYYVSYDMSEDDCEYEIDNLSVTVEEC